MQISAPLVSTPRPPTPFQQFKSNPSRFLANWLYAHRPPLASAVSSPHGLAAAASGANQTLIRLVCISDTHNSTSSRIPDGDVLLHAGDLTNKGSFAELQAQLDWMNTLPHAHKVVIGGNHDTLLDEEFIAHHPDRVEAGDLGRRSQLQWGDIVYLNQTSATVTVRHRKLTIFGSPLTPQCGTFAFQYLPIRDVWKNCIPDGTDIVLTHGPPKGHLDSGGKGCPWLLAELWRVRPRAVVFGHVHSGRGEEAIAWDWIQTGYDFPTFLNVIMMTPALGWSWARNRLGKRRAADTRLVNAAWAGEEKAVQVVQV